MLAVWRFNNSYGDLSTHFSKDHFMNSEEKKIIRDSRLMIFSSYILRLGKEFSYDIVAASGENCFYKSHKPCRGNYSMEVVKAKY